MTVKTFVFSFEDGDGGNKKLLGGKGANLCAMTQIGLPVPPGFVISTDACLDYLGQKKKGLSPDLMKQIREAMVLLQEKTRKGLATLKSPCWFPCDRVRPFQCPV
jgi:pyruvate,orthophosphate dikinase